MAQERPAESKEARDARMKWWREARFGMFIHWGVYSVPAGVYKGQPMKSHGGEWILHDDKIPLSEYREFAKQFNPVRYDPEAWAALAEAAGMKYVVITSKHHDGFALFDSKVTKWDVVDATPYGKDLIAPLAAAARRHGLKFGLYYSQAQDWIHPGGTNAATKRATAGTRPTRGTSTSISTRSPSPRSAKSWPPTTPTSSGGTPRNT